jgi:hypothetical protein
LIGESRNWQQRPHLSWELGAGSWEIAGNIVLRTYVVILNEVKDPCTPERSFAALRMTA